MFTDEYFMKIALKEAQNALQKDEVPIGAIIVADNKIIAKAHNLSQELTDPTAHAEMLAITAACNTLNSRYLDDCTLYVTVEPCPMCAGASFWSQLGRVVFGTADVKNGFRSKCINIMHPKTVLNYGVLEHECSSIIKDFFKGKR